MSTPNLVEDRNREVAPPPESRMDTIKRRLSTFGRRMSVDERQLDRPGFRNNPRSKANWKSRESWYSNDEHGPLDRSVTFNDTKNQSNAAMSEYGNTGYDQEVALWRGEEENQIGPHMDLTDWAGKVNGTMSNMDALSQSLNDLQIKFRMHLSDLSMVEENKKKIAIYEQQCREKDDQIQNQLATISTLTKISLDQEKKMADERNAIEEQRKELGREHLEKSRGIDAVIAREKKNLQDDYEKTMNSHRQGHENHIRQLEDDFKRQKEENNRRLTALDAENKQLSRTVQEQLQKLQNQDGKLKRNVQRSEVLQQSLQSHKKLLEDREKELGMMKSAFTPRSRSLEDMKSQFSRISAFIEEISTKYFTDPIERDPGTVHEQLVSADPLFANVPIDESEVSYNLRLVHVQRVISEALCEYIWRPFSSEYTLAHEDLGSFLFQMMNALDSSSLSGQPANIWTALTMRALELLQEGSHQKSGSKSPSNGRAKNVLSKVYSVLSPLLTPSKSRNFASDLGALADLAIDVWQTAQTGDYRIKVIPRLDPARYQEWRSQAFDPMMIRDSRNMVSDDIFILFPRVDAMILSGRSERSPRSSPSESERNSVIGVCLHPGKGLPQSSELVLNGIQAQEEINNYIEIAKREARMKRNTDMHGRRASTTHSAPRPSNARRHEHSQSRPTQPVLAS